MARLTRIARRTFLVGSAAIAGGVAFGIYKVRVPHPNPLADDVGPEGVTFNPWVMIDPSGITLVTPHADIGQGTISAQAMLIAEEMDLEPGQFRVSFGEPSPAYWNTALANDAVPFRATDESLAAELGRKGMAALAKVLGLQITGGSSSIPDSFDKLRHAGAVARETLKLAAARQTGMKVSELRTEAASVVLPDGTRLSYVELAPDAAAIPPVREVALRPPSAWRLIGKPHQRLDIVAKSTGTQKYTIDLELPGMLHATVRRNPRQGGGIVRYDAQPALAMRGVKKVLPVTGGVAVVADNTWRAFRAAEAIICEWGEAPFPAEQAEHWAAVEAAFTSESLDREWRNDGDLDAALTSGDIVEAEYRAPYVAHQPLEPLAAVALVTEEGAEVWASHQIPRILQAKVAAITGHDPARVVFHNQMGGGSFGHRLEFDFVTLAAEIAAQMQGTPIKLTFRREEDFLHDYPRPLGIGRGRGRVENGQVRAVDLAIATPSVTRSQSRRAGIPAAGPDSQIVAGAWNLGYAIPDFRVRAHAVPGLAPVSSWRSVGASIGGFVIDCFLDELIHAAGADPLEERLRLMADPLSRRVLETVGEISGWGAPLAPGRGRGVAFVESFGVPVAEVVEVTGGPDGIAIDRVFVAAAVGHVVDPVNFENQVQGGVIWGLGHAMGCETTFADGMAEQTNFDAWEFLRIHQCPEIVVKGLSEGPVRGIGEPPVPPAAPALANAIFAATGKRLREMPFNRFVTFA